MKKACAVSMVVAAGSLLIAAGQAGLPEAAGSPGIQATYYGRPAPGAEAVKFWPEVLAGDRCPHGQLAFSPDGKGVFWSAFEKGTGQKVYFSTFDGQAFSPPAVAPFATASANAGPAFSPDGKRLFFSAGLMAEQDSAARPTVILYVEKTGLGWSQPRPIEATVGTLMTKGQMSIARGGNIYFSGRFPEERWPAIFSIRHEDGRYLSPVKLGGPLATVPLLCDPWVDPDERFLLVSFPRQEGSPTLTDIGISFRQPDGSWSLPARLGGAVNTEAFERFPSLSPDGKYLFFIRSFGREFASDQAYFYWVDARVIGQVTQKESTGQTAREALGRPLESGQAVIWYLYHSGWAVKTQNHLLIFDDTEPPERPSRRSLDAGSVDPAEIADQDVTVLVSHDHDDHLDPRILGWRTAVKKIRYVWGWDGEGTPADIHFGKERRTVSADGLEILNIHHEFDGIPESAFLVKVDGLAILHAGDHGHSKGAANPVFMDNLLYLAAQAPRLDIFFTPTFGGEIDAIRTLKPQVVFPMHDGGNERQYAKFAEKAKVLGLEMEVGTADKPGARFLYSGRKLTAI